APDLHEHDRSNVPMMRTREFISAVAQFFADPEQLTLGLETARQAGDRITQAIEQQVERHPRQNLAIVSHGTVLALFAAARVDEPPFQLWRNLGLPSLLVFEIPS